jgi:type I restriction enzyme S subunit
VPLKDIGTIVTGTTPATRRREFYGGTVPFVTPPDLDGTKWVTNTKQCLSHDGLAVSRPLPRGCILVSCIGTLGKVGLTTADQTTTNQQINAIIPEDGVDPEFIYYTMMTQRRALERAAGGVTIKIVNKSNFEQLTIRLPPLGEQRRIARILSTIQRARDASDNEAKATALMRRSVIGTLFGEAEKWPLRRIGDVAKTGSGGTPRRDRDRYYGGPIPWVKSGEVRDCTITTTSESITQDALSSSSAKIFPRGTLLVAMYGATAGQVGILGIDAATNQAVCAVTPVGTVSSHYLYFALQEARERLKAARYGGAQPNLSQQTIRNFQLRIPNAKTQQHIVRVLGCIDEKVRAVRAQGASKAAVSEAALSELMAAHDDARV